MNEDKLKKLEQDIRAEAIAKYANYVEDCELETSPWERFKHSEELHEDFCGSFDLYCDWLNTGNFTEFDEKARSEWMAWARERFPGIEAEAEKAYELMMGGDMSPKDAALSVLGKTV